MAKMGGGGGGGMPRPMPNPRLNPGMAPPGAPAGGGMFGGGGGGMFGNMPVQARFDMAMDLLKNGMSMAAGSGSPLAAFLAPLAGAVIGGGIESKRAKMAGAEEDSLMAAMMPGGISPEMKRLSGIISDPNTPDHLRAVAKARFDAGMAPPKVVKGGGGKGKARVATAPGSGGGSTGVVTIGNYTIEQIH